MTDIKVGDLLKVVDGYGPRLNVREVVVTKVARVWITTGSGRGEQKFRLVTQMSGTGESFDSRFYTLEQWAERKRKINALAFLADQGIEIRWESPWHARRAELADIIRAALATADSSPEEV